MAIFHCSISNVSRASGGSACSALAYISGEKVFDERTNKTYNFGHKDRILDSETVIPDFAPDKFNNPATLFNDIELFDSSINARTAKKIQLALPKELNLDLQKKCVENFIKHNLTNEGYCAFFAIHDGGQNQNVHAHILVANRSLNKNGDWSCKRKMAYALDNDSNRIPILDKNGNQKTDSHGRKQWKRLSTFQNKLDDKQFLFQLRQNWANEVNKFLPENLHIDHRSYSERGLTDKPTIHEGYAARAIEKKGGISERCQFNRNIKRDNAELHSLHKDIAFKQTQLANLQSVADNSSLTSILTNIIASAINQFYSMSGGTGPSNGSVFKKDYAELLKNASSPEEIAKILAEIEELTSGIQPIGGGVVIDYLEIELQLERQRELDERYEKFKQRRRDVGAIRISPIRLRNSPEQLRNYSPTKSTISTGLDSSSNSASGHSSSSPNHSRPAGRDYVAELQAFLREESERDTARALQKIQQTRERERRIANSAQPTTLPTSTNQRPVATSQLKPTEPSSRPRQSEPPIQQPTIRQQQPQSETPRPSVSNRTKRPKNSQSKTKPSGFGR